MKKIIAHIALLCAVCAPLALVAAACGVDAQSQSVIDELRNIEAQVREIRGDDSNPAAPRVELLSQAEMNAFITDLIESEAAQNAAEFAIEEAVYKLLGVLEPSDSLADALVDQYGESVLGTYDPEDGAIRVTYAEGEPLSRQTVLTYVHEYVHYLQDLNYDISADERSEGYDSALAWTALVEGDATAATDIYSERFALELAMFDAGAEASSEEMLREQLEAQLVERYFISRLAFFPYSSGPVFVATVVDHDDSESLDSVFENPPVSTEQTLFPSVYLSGKETPIEVDADLFAEVAGWSAAGFDETLGLLAINAWLIDFSDIIGVASRATNPLAAFGSVSGDRYRWGGDRLQLLENAAGDRGLRWAIVWDDAEVLSAADSAAAFESALSQAANVNPLISAPAPGCRLDDDAIASFAYNDAVLLHKTLTHAEHGDVTTIAIAPSCEAAAALLPSGD